jgi:type VI protein secretion system component VasK
MERDRLSVIAFLVTLAIVATVFMFLNALIVYVLGPAARVYILSVGVPSVIVLLLFGLVLLALALTNATHFYKSKWENRENHYEALRRHRALELEKHRQQASWQPRQRIRLVRQVQRRYRRFDP